MSTSHRICETCVYWSFAGNCDRHDKPLTSIEQPACDAYEIHPLLAENAKLRELVEDMAAEMRGLGVDFGRVGWCDYADRMRELGVDA